jgi:hypothetical protein
MSIRSQLEGKQFSELNPFIDALSTGVNEEIQTALSPLQSEVDRLTGIVTELQTQVTTLGGLVQDIAERPTGPDAAGTPPPPPTTTPSTVPGSGTGAVGPTGVIPNAGPDEFSPVGPITPLAGSPTPPSSPPDTPDEFVVGPFPWLWNPIIQQWVNTFATPNT